MILRIDGRRADQLREVRITRGWLDHAEGSVLVEFGKTRVLIAASVTVGVDKAIVSLLPLFTWKKNGVANSE